MIMGIWFLDNASLLLREREAIEELEASADWLKGLDWQLDGNLCIDAVLDVSGKEYQVRLTYPKHFPSVPPAVRPKKADERWSTHQYQDGTLCLEWGSDNWHPDLTAKDALESTYRLLSIENPSDSQEEGIIAPSRHDLSIGQELRDKFGKVLFGYRLQDYLKSLPEPSQGTMNFSIQWQSKSLTIFIQKIEPKGTPLWEDFSIPEGVRATPKSGTLGGGFYCKTDLPSQEIEEISNSQQVHEFLDGMGLNRSEIDIAASFFGILILDREGAPHFLLVWKSQDEKSVYHLSPIIETKDSLSDRTPQRLQALKEKSVSIVGMGSVGGRLAISLARMGVSQFLLIDDDVILPQNISRHVSDWKNVGEHKVDAIAEILKRINPCMNVQVSRVNLTRQESATVVNRVLSKLGEMDLLIDATADPKAFNLLSAVAIMNNKPLLWSAVYDGGIGGMIARSRPGQDPNPQTMRAAYNQYLASSPHPDLTNVGDYVAETTEGETLSASDADVGAITYHAARLAADTLLDAGASIFPHSMYLIGMQQSWIFDQPFDTIPIQCDHIKTKNRPDVSQCESSEANKAFLTNLLKKTDNENSGS